MMTCEECGAEEVLFVDGRRMSEEELLARVVAPKNIFRVIEHKRWCPYQQGRYQI